MFTVFEDIKLDAFVSKPLQLFVCFGCKTKTILLHTKECKKKKQNYNGTSQAHFIIDKWRSQKFVIGIGWNNSKSKKSHPHKV